MVVVWVAESLMGDYYVTVGEQLMYNSKNKDEN